MHANDTSAAALAQQLLYAVKAGEETMALQAQLADLQPGQLQQQLDTDAQKNAFWLNVYNAYTQIMLQQSPGAYQHRNHFFGAKKIVVAGKKLSLDDIEHGLLRRSRNKWLMGYMGKIFVDKTERQWRVKCADYRIHFALNCGANSCPPIAFYQPDKLDRQLQMATAGFLKANCRYDSTKNEVWVPKILSWFRGDFGGKKGIRQLLARQGIIATESKPRLRFTAYNWALSLATFAE